MNNIRLEYSYIIHLWFALLIVATTFSKLRFYKLFFGVHDVMFVLTLLALFTFRQNKAFVYSVFFFVLMITVTQLVNLIANDYIAGDHRFGGKAVLYDLVTLLLNILFISVIFNNYKISIPKLLYSLYIVTFSYLVIIFILGVLLKLDFFYWKFDITNLRLSGLSRNPNQTSLVVILFSGLSLYYYFRTKCSQRRIIHFFALLFSILVAKYIDSDALYIAIATLISFSIFFMSTKFYRALIIVFALYLLFYVGLNIDIMESYLDSFQAKERLARWQSFMGLFPQVLLIGFGLGAHGPSFEHSFGFSIGNPLQNVEFHNTYLDLFSQFGIMFGLIILATYLYFLFKSYRKENYIFIAIGLGLLAMSFFHYYLRHPLFWFLILMPFIFNYKQRNKCAE